jgi:secreted PhoX family phosphatase
MVYIDRRRFLQGAAATAGAAVFGGPFAGLLTRAGAVSSEPSFRHLRAVPDLRDGVVRLWLPEGFQYRSFHDNSAVPAPTLDDGRPVPGRHDGMAAFAGPAAGTVWLVRNHEINGPGAPFSTSAPIYDPMARGGTTTIAVDLEGNVSSAVASLAGTQMNCAGGRLPWAAWITCEETINGPDVFDDFTRGTLPTTTYIQNAQLTKPHGFIFEVPTAGSASAAPVHAAGRFAHESVALDPIEGALYLTEDDFGFPSGFYKYVPPHHPLQVGRIEDGGQLFMLAVDGAPNAPLGDRQPLRASYRVRWVPIPDPSPTFPMAGASPTTTNDQAIHTVASQGWADGAAYFSRLEGSYYDTNIVYFCSTQGGGDPEDPDVSTPRAAGYGKGFGQVWAYHTRGQHLELLYQSPGRAVLDFPDNVTVSRRGTLVLCEDSTDFNFLRGLSRGGQLFDIAVNQIPGRTNEEFAGATFSPDFHTLYVNIQASLGQSLAIWGPWETVGV